MYEYAEYSVYGTYSMIHVVEKHVCALSTARTGLPESRSRASVGVVELLAITALSEAPEDIHSFSRVPSPVLVVARSLRCACISISGCER